MPPKGLGLRWKLIGTINTRVNGPRVLWNAAETPIFKMVYGNNSALLSKLGYGRDTYRGGVAFWAIPDASDEVNAATQFALREAILDTRKNRHDYRVRNRRVIQERRDEQARLAAELETRRGAVRENLARILSERFWAIHHRYLDEVKALAEKTFLDAADVTRAEQIIKSTDKTVEKARASLDEEQKAAEEDLRVCQDEGVRVTILKAVRHITGNDEDWAAIRNDIGWSKATTVVGHVLAMADDLSALHAAHALRLLRHHRKQVPAEFREALRIAA